MKKILSILFLSLFIYNMAGYFVVFKAMQYQVRKEVKRRIKQSVPENELIAISFLLKNKDHIEWTKKDKEFRYKGDMYDVVKQEIKGSNVVYYCIKDFKESKLFANLDEHVERHLKNNPKQRNKAENILKKAVKDYYFDESNNKNHALSIVCKYNNINQNYNSINLGVLSPPPKVI